MKAFVKIALLTIILVSILSYTIGSAVPQNQPVMTVKSSCIPYLNRLVWAESRGKTNAKSHRGAIGLMQITQPALDDYKTFEGVEYTLNDMYNDYHNVKVGTWYIERLRKSFTNEVEVVSAYNMGFGNGKNNIINVDYASSILGKERVLQYLKGKSCTSWKGTWKVWVVSNRP